jgi:hypothetical protein
MKLSDAIAKLAVPPDVLEVTFGGDAVIKLKPTRNTVRMAELVREAEAWAKDARALAPDDIARQALGELAGDEGLEAVVYAYIIAEMTIEDDMPINERRYGMCKLAAFSWANFNKIRTALNLELLQNPVKQLLEAIEGKAGSGSCPECNSDCKSPETCGASTPTN